MPKKTPAQLDREIAAALARKPPRRHHTTVRRTNDDELDEPDIKPLDDADWGTEAWFEKMRRIEQNRQAKIARAFKRSAAIIVTDAYNREVLLIKSGEPSGRGFRVSSFGHDGPIGHMTRDTEAKLIEETARDHHGKVRSATDDEVMAWTGTPEFEEGARRVAEVQKWNQRGGRG